MRNKLVTIFILVQIVLLSSCLSKEPSSKKYKQNKTYIWELTMLTSGGIAGKEEKISIQSNGIIQIDDLLRNRISRHEIQNKKNLNLIYLQLKNISKGKIEPKNNTKNFNSRCNDCQSTTIEFKLNNKKYSIYKSSKVNGEFLFTELENTILKIQNNSLNKQGLENL